MRYLAFLRGVNVGGNSIVSMAAIKDALIAIGMADVRTYINSGNVILSSAEMDREKVAASVEEALEKHTGMAIKVLVINRGSLKTLVEAIPSDWVDDRTMRSYVLLLWKEFDDPEVLARLPARAGVDNLLYTPGAVVWRVERQNVTRSGMNRLVGTPLYKKMTMRSVNTMRKLDQLAEGA